jgi:hypothetical protein
MILRAFIRSLVFVVLTLLTQIGGLVYLAILILAKVFEWRSKFIVLIIFVLGYASASFATSFLSPLFGRYPVSCWASQTATLKIANPLYCFLNRHYVTKDVLVLLQKASAAVDTKFNGTQTLVLDANFPFLDGFPLLPHLSHDDGRKVDLAFYYQDGKGGYLPGTMKSPIGYWGYTQPREGEPAPCENYNKLSLRWDFDFLQKEWRDYRLEPMRTAFLLNWLVGEGQKYGFEKALLEPHIKSRLDLKSNLIRFQGCRAARHDDHIHLQVGG